MLLGNLREREKRPLAAGQPEFRRLADEIIFNRTSDPVILSRKYGDGIPGMFPCYPFLMLPAFRMLPRLCANSLPSSFPPFQANAGI